MKHIYLDVSGSLPKQYEPLIERIVSTHQPANLFDFDHRVAPHGKLPYGGGTDIDPVIRHANAAQVDEVVVITDGYFMPPEEAISGNWTWYITPNGVKPRGVEGTIIMEAE